MPPRTTYIARGNQRLVPVVSKVFNVDNGAGTKDAYPTINLPFDAYLVSVRAVYTEATDTTGAASANFRVGVASDGSTLVAATALEAAKAIGATTSATIVLDVLPANTTLWITHTGVAATEVGQYFVQVLLLPKP